MNSVSDGGLWRRAAWFPTAGVFVALRHTAPTRRGSLQTELATRRATNRGNSGSLKTETVVGVNLQAAAPRAAGLQPVFVAAWFKLLPHPALLEPKPLGDNVANLVQQDVRDRLFA